MSINAIPWTAIDRYCEAEGVVDRERFLRLIRAMDQVLLDDVRGDDEDGDA